MSLLDVVLNVWGYPVTVLEMLAFATALACVVLEVLEIHWAWPLAMLSSGLYGWLFFEYRLYGDAGLQVFFIVVACWGWWQWLFARRAPVSGQAESAAQPLGIARLGWPRFVQCLIGCLFAWLALGFWLDRFTDTDVPWFDALPTAGSVLGQLLLGRKYLETWLVWIAVNLVGVALFIYKDLWLTALLYGIFVLLAVLGYRRWRHLLQRQADER